jgi:tripartite-type tricarboxylate transporter receptor subunit TctC
MQMHRRHFVHALGSAAALGSLSPLQVLAQALDQVKIMYGFPAGSSGDSVARRVAERLGGTPYSKGPGFVENKPGAGGRIAVEALKNAPPNGSVLALAPVSAFSVYPHIYPKLTYRPEDAMAVSIGAVIYHGLAVGPAVPAEVRTLKDFLAWAKAHPDRANFGSPGAGSMPHLLGALLACARGWNSSTRPIAAPCPASPTLWVAKSRPP